MAAGASLGPGPHLVFLYDDLFLRHQSPGHPESPDRLRAITEQLYSEPRLAHCPWRTAPAATDEDILLVHTSRHLEHIRSLSASGGGWIDADTYCDGESLAVAVGAVGVSLAAVELATGSPATSAFALVRPPGHHATPERAMGFCLFNNVAIAVRHAQTKLGAERVAVVDLDVHHGNGTQDIFYQDGSVLYCSLHQLPLYPGSGTAAERGIGAGLGQTINVPLAPGTGPDRWLAALREVVVPAIRQHHPQLVLVSAGFDALAGDPLAQLELLPETYAAAAQMLAQVAVDVAAAPTVWVLEGGYDLSQMPEAVRQAALALAAA
ncbi:MAG: histone deacetylase [Candidatus Dormiibacterota bacterium]